MKFALVNENKTEAQPEMRRGNCLYCQSETIAKCGHVKIWHWAHKSKVSCDSWWENETEWHRAWKNHFPKEWQEHIHADSVTGEKHIADIKTASGLVIEFQHSAIKPAEIQSREAFYKNMVWVVDGTRLKRDCPRFREGINDSRNLIVDGFFLSLIPSECFPASWLKSSKPVYFDFDGINSPIDQLDEKRAFWCLFPDRLDGYAVIAGVLCKQFMELSFNASHLLFAHENLRYISEYIRLKRQSAFAHTRREYPNALPRRYVRRQFRF
ncbi:MAG TPA: competence protein CoiA family protein [Candidatus Omnitrophota bacterium]|nr:competence protein CoiA family protein [Candidatus Omnitrophota bacterium]